MFYSHLVLTKKGPLAKVWLAATVGESKISRTYATSANIHKLCENIEQPDAPFALRLSASLMLGVVRVYSKKSTIILTNVNSVFEQLNSLNALQVTRSTKRKLKSTTSEKGAGSGPHNDDDIANFDAITLPVQRKRRTRRSTRTYALPALSSNRSRDSEPVDPNVELLADNMDMDVLRAMQSLFPSVPVPRLGEHLSSHQSPALAANRRTYEARDQDITLATPVANLNMQFDMFEDEEAALEHGMPVDLGNSAMGDDWFGGDDMGIGQVEALDFQPPSRSHSRAASEAHPQGVGSSVIVPRALPPANAVTDEQPAFQAPSPDFSDDGPLPQPGTTVWNLNRQDNAGNRDGSTAGTPSGKEKTDSLALRSAIKKKRATKVVVDDVTELPPSHIRSCLSDTADIIFTGERTAAPRRRRRLTFADEIIQMPSHLNLFPKEISNLWNDVVSTAIKINLGATSAHTLSPSNNTGKRSNAIALGQGDMSGPQDGSSGRRDSSDSPSLPPAIPYFDDDYPPAPMELEQPRAAAGPRPSVDVLRAGDGSSNPNAANAEVASLLSRSVASGSHASRRQSAPSVENMRDGLLDFITDEDHELYANARRMSSVQPTGTPQRAVEAEHGDGTPQGLPQESGSPGRVQGDDLDAARIPVDSSEFQLIEQTQRPGWERRASQGPVDAIGVRGYKLLEVLRAQARQHADQETGIIRDAYATTFHDLTAECSKGAIARTLFNVLKLATSGFITVSQQNAYGTITLKPGTFF